MSFNHKNYFYITISAWRSDKERSECDYHRGKPHHSLSRINNPHATAGQSSYTCFIELFSAIKKASLTAGLI
nr:hypothetical protein B7L51_11410 [Pectobacterium carotovorum]